MLDGRVAINPEPPTREPEFPRSAEVLRPTIAPGQFFPFSCAQPDRVPRLPPEDVAHPVIADGVPAYFGSTRYSGTEFL